MMSKVVAKRGQVFKIKSWEELEEKTWGEERRKNKNICTS